MCCQISFQTFQHALFLSTLVVSCSKFLVWSDLLTARKLIRNTRHALCLSVRLRRKRKRKKKGICGRKSGNKIYCVSRSKQTVCLHSLEVITNPIVGRSPEPGLCRPFMLHDAAVAGLICSWLKAGPGSVQGNVIDSAYEKRKTAGKLLGSSGYL